ncbi:MAG: hypothetical protein LBH92_04680 [Bacteroidales bacterium]|jgi:hypothetical protein|nr:hypothetical protein [Bacteroidales bacterium]
MLDVTGNVRNYFFKRKLNKNAKDVFRVIRLTPFSSVKYVGLIVGRSLIEKDSEGLKKIIELLNHHKKNYFFIILTDKKHLPEFLNNLPHIVISKKDVTFSQAPSDKITQKLKVQKFDFLIDLNQQPLRSAFFIEAVSDATLRIGKASSERYPYVDFMVEWRDSDTVLQFFENIIYYLSMMTEKADRKK